MFVVSFANLKSRALSRNPSAEVRVRAQASHGNITVLSHLESNFLLIKFRQCKDYSEQSKPYFEPWTFAKLRCLLKPEFFDFVCLHFSEFFPDNFRNQTKRFR